MPKSTRTEKVLYIAAHPELLAVSRVQLANALKKAGLVSFATSPVDLSPRRLCEEARAVIEKGASEQPAQPSAEKEQQ